MRRLFALLALLLLAVAPAAAFDTPQALLKALYTPYLAGDDFDWNSWDESRFRSAHLNELFAKDAAETPDGMVGRLDFDVYIDGQDYQITDLAFGDPQIDGDKATVEVSFKNFDTPDKLEFTLVKEADGWKVDDVVSRDAEFPYSLKQIMESPLPQ